MKFLSPDAAADPYTEDGNALGGPLPEHIESMKRWWRNRLQIVRGELDGL